MATYTELADNVLAWSNRDEQVLSYSLIKQFLNYAADEAYRTLRIQPLEKVVTYNALSKDDEGAFGNLIVPSDLIEFIQLRRQRRDAESNAATPEYTYDVYTAKQDIRSFYEPGFGQWGDCHTFARERNRLLCYPAKEDDIFELYYYARLPAPDAYYTVTVRNANNGDLTRIDPNIDDKYLVDVPQLTVAAGSDFIGVTVEGTEVAAGDTLYGTPAPNWLLDNNEKILLFGALAQAFDYLDEADQSQKYNQKFQNEITMLNYEDKKRMGSGGNLQTRFYSNLI